MIWPPTKAWTSKLTIAGNRYFVAINYSNKLSDKWVILMSVLDSNIVIKVSWLDLLDKSMWNCGWDQAHCACPSQGFVKQEELIISNCNYPSADSGLTVPISKKNIRPWFVNH